MEEIREIVGHRPLILVGSVVVMVNEQQEVLLQQRGDPHGVWGLPGGLMELGESVEDTARREVYEETGLEAGELKLVGVFSGPDYFVRLKNGDEFYVVTNAFSTHDFRGTLRADRQETLDLRFFHPSTLPGSMVGSHRKIIEAFAAQ